MNAKTNGHNMYSLPDTELLTQVNEFRVCPQNFENFPRAAGLWEVMYNELSPPPTHARGRMTPEEQFTTIRNTLGTITENMALHESAFRDLVLVSRTVLTSIQEIKIVLVKDREDWQSRMRDLHDAQAATDENLNILINTVDRIIRQRNQQ